MTTAAKTGFALSTIDTWGYTFTFDGNQKITAGNGTFEEPVANAFSLVHKEDCPQSTEICRSSCYVNNLEIHQEEVFSHYRKNSENMRKLMDNPFDVFPVASEFAVWIEENANDGFRWHVSGDVFSEDYAWFIRHVVAQSPDVYHWIYTRSFDFLHVLVNLPNLKVNISADKDNYEEARKVADKYDLQVCYLTMDGEVPSSLLEGDVIFPDYALRGVDMKPHTFREGSEWWNGLSGDQKKMVCPVDVYGKSEQVRCGPCKKCL